MPEQNERHIDLWARMTLDPRCVFLERDLRRLRWQLTRNDCSRAIVMARVKLAATFEYMARRMRPKVDVNSVRLS
jgi:hypothetical protein